jgi:hypothetical protein
MLGVHDCVVDGIPHDVPQDDRMTARRKSDRRRDDLYAGGLRKRALAAAAG